MLPFELDTLLHSPKPFVGHHFWIHLPYLLPRNFQFNFGMGHHHRRRTLSVLVRTEKFLPSCLPTLLFTSSSLAVILKLGIYVAGTFLDILIIIFMKFNPPKLSSGWRS
jgi:hypothetical protein